MLGALIVVNCGSTSSVFHEVYCCSVVTVQRYNTIHHLTLNSSTICLILRVHHLEVGGLAPNLLSPCVRDAVTVDLAYGFGGCRWVRCDERQHKHNNITNTPRCFNTPTNMCFDFSYAQTYSLIQPNDAYLEIRPGRWRHPLSLSLSRLCGRFPVRSCLNGQAPQGGWRGVCVGSAGARIRSEEKRACNFGSNFTPI